MRRNVTFGLGLAVVVAASAAGFGLGRQIRSPAEIAARTAAPPLSLISVPIEKRVLTADVVVRGTVRFGAAQTVALPTSALKKGNGIVTTAAVKAAELKEGSVALAVSGRPVFVLQGAQPAYRDIGPGAIGADVAQLEEALGRMGFGPGPADGVYDERTAGAVAAWYQAAGWTPLGPTDEQLQAVRSAQSEFNAAQSEVFGAQDALASAHAGLATAQDRARMARVAAQAAPAVDAAAARKAEQDRLAASAEVARQTAAVQTAGDAERVARIRLSEGRATNPSLPASELAALEAAVADASRVVGVARADLAAAQYAVGVVPPPTAPTSPAANGDAVAAEAELARAADVVNMAQRRLGVVAGRPASGTLSQLSSKLGTQVAADEVLFFPSLPLRVDEVKIPAGEQGVGPVMTVSNSRLAVFASLSVNDRKLVTKDAAVTIEQPDLAVKVVGVVSEVADTPGTRGAEPQRFYLEVTPTDAPTSLVGASVVLSITVETTRDEVLAVPVASLALAADGSSRVQVQAADHTTRYVTVTPGLAAQGRVAVVPVNDTLIPGDLVVVGTNGGSNAKP